MNTCEKSSLNYCCESILGGNICICTEWISGSHRKMLRSQETLFKNKPTYQSAVGLNYRSCSLRGMDVWHTAFDASKKTMECYFSLKRNIGDDRLFDIWRLDLSCASWQNNDHQWQNALQPRPGSLILPRPVASEERAWHTLLTCLPESGRWQLNY